MRTQQIEKLTEEVKDLKERFKDLQVIVDALLVKDAEGEYRPSFVRKIKQATRETPRHQYKGKKDFLKQLHK